LKKYTKTYLDFFGYDITDFVPCEICEAKAVDIHHIECRGMGGSKEKDTIENLMALCRLCHFKYGEIKHQLDYLKEIHLKKIADK